MSDDEFNWKPDNPDVITQRQDAIAVYENVAGDVVIRREKDWDDEDDTFIVVNKAHVPALVQAILRTAGLEPQGLLPPPSPSTDPTGAERQKCFRERHRNGVM